MTDIEEPCVSDEEIEILIYEASKKLSWEQYGFKQLSDKEKFEKLKKNSRKIIVFT